MHRFKFPHILAMSLALAGLASVAAATWGGGLVAMLAQAVAAPLLLLSGASAWVALGRLRRQAEAATARGRDLEAQIKLAAVERQYAAAALAEAARAVVATGAAAGDTAAAPAPPVAPPRQSEIAEMKNDFVSMVSHELRTPLASIKAYAEMLIDGEAVDETTRREFYEIIQNEATRLGRLIDNILAVARIESGLLKPVRLPLDLSAVAREAIEAIASQAAQKQVRIDDGGIAPSPPGCPASADHDMIFQSVVNLLSNAIKYTPEGGSVTVQTRFDLATGRSRVCVADAGVGIPAGEMPFVYDKFFRANANSRTATGSGLGLSLVKQIVETGHGGRVFASSEVGKGSTFGFELDGGGTPVTRQRVVRADDGSGDGNGAVVGSSVVRMVV